jgi:hypothetical protein
MAGKWLVRGFEKTWNVIAGDRRLVVSRKSASMRAKEKGNHWGK